MTLKGKGFFIWKVKNCEGGDPQAIAMQAGRAGLTHILVKIANGTLPYNIDKTNEHDLVPPLVDALRALGIQVWGWHYLLGDNPSGEATRAIRRINQLSLDGYVIDAEKEFFTPDKKKAAQQFMQQLRKALPSLPVALSSYRFPSLHSQFPWREFLDKCDYNMPQVYWMKAHNPGAQLARCVREFQALSPARPIIPTGAAFREHGWQPTVEEVLEFMQAARSLNLSAFNFWEWSMARAGNLPGIWEGICKESLPNSESPTDICEQFFNALNSHDPGKVASLYAASAVHITSARTIQGTQAIQQWYQILFKETLPGASFRLTGYGGNQNTRHFVWTATSPQGKVENGNDTIGLLNDHIHYHYSRFTVN